LSCLVRLTLAPLLGDHAHGKNNGSADGKKMESTQGEGASCCKDKKADSSDLASDNTTYQMTSTDTLAH